MEVLKKMLFKSLLEDRLRELNISQRDAAKLMHISPSYLTVLKKGGSDRLMPSRKKMAAIASGLKVPIYDIEKCFISSTKYIQETLAPELQDERLRSIVEYWAVTDDENKKLFYQMIKIYLSMPHENQILILTKIEQEYLSSWPFAEEAIKYNEHSKERANFIWEKACEEFNVKNYFSREPYQDDFVDYKKWKTSDAELFHAVKNKINNFIKKLENKQEDLE